MLIGPLEINFFIYENAFQNVVWKKSGHFLGLNELIDRVSRLGDKSITVNKLSSYKLHHWDTQTLDPTLNSINTEYTG